MTNITIISRSNRTPASRTLAKTAGLLLLLSSFAGPHQAAACDTSAATKQANPGLTDKTQKDQSPIEPDYYHSTDNPFFAD